MTEHIRRLGLGKLVVSLIGVVAMVAIVTGAVAASSGTTGPSHKDATFAPGDPTGSALASATVKVTPSHETEGSEESEEPTAARTAKPTSSATSSATAGQTCDPNADKVEDQAELQAEIAEHKAPNSEASEAPEATEPPVCKPADPDNDGDGHVPGAPGFPNPGKSVKPSTGPGSAPDHNLSGPDKGPVRFGHRSFR